jgi:hypothetical protein
MQDAKFFEKQATPDFSKTYGRRKIAAIPSCNQMKTPLIATWYRINMAVDANAMPFRVIVTDGTTADYTQASKLIEGS